jgi:hypothetical protein
MLAGKALGSLFRTTLFFLTPVDTRWQGLLGSTGVTENAKTPVFPGFFTSFCFDSPVL